MHCPICKKVRQTNAVECPYCGIIYDKLEKLTIKRKMEETKSSYPQSSERNDPKIEINKRQKIILLTMAVCIFLMLIFPPFHSEWNGKIANKGYNFIFSPPKQGYISSTVNIGLLVVQWIAVLLLGGLYLIVFSGEKKITSSLKNTKEINSNLKENSSINALQDAVNRHDQNNKYDPINKIANKKVEKDKERQIIGKNSVIVSAAVAAIIFILIFISAGIYLSGNQGTNEVLDTILGLILILCVLVLIIYLFLGIIGLFKTISRKKAFTVVLISATTLLITFYCYILGQ